MNRSLPLAGLFTLLWGGQAAAGIDVGVQPSVLTVSPGSTFDVEVVVSGTGSNFNSFDAIIGHDPAALTLIPLAPLSLQEGGLMTAACGNRFHRFRTGADRDTATIVLLCNGTSVTGPGSIYRLRFQASSTPQVTTIQLLPGLRFFDAGVAVTGIVSSDATITIGDAVDVRAVVAVDRWRLVAQPNPFVAATRLVIDAPQGGAQELVVFDVRGRLVRRLFAEQSAPGRREILWDGNTDAGRPVPAGLYFARLRGPSSKLVTRLVRTLGQ